MKNYIEIKAENQRRTMITQYSYDLENKTDEEITSLIMKATTHFYISQKTYTRILHIKVNLNGKLYKYFENTYKR